MTGGIDAAIRPDEVSPRDRAAEGRYRPDLDGLRAIAVGLVIIGHTQWPWRQNGADAGVTAFFVLSGYLITGILVRERQRTGSIRLRNFYRRRFVRLAPALLGLLVFALVLGLAGDLSGQWQLGLVSCLLYVSNWVQAAGIAIHPIGHTWSLAIEEQFYLLWPLVLLVAWRRALPLAGAAIAIAVLLRLGSAGYFEYFSTITRMDALAVGCVVGLLQPRWPSWVALAGVITLITAAMLLSADNHDLAIPISIVATTAVIGGELRPLGRLAPVGLRAYSLYLWNTPMNLLFGPLSIVTPVLTFALGEVSFRLFEVPVLRRGGARRAPRIAGDRLATGTAPADAQ